MTDYIDVHRHCRRSTVYWTHVSKINAGLSMEFGAFTLGMVTWVVLYWDIGRKWSFQWSLASLEWIADRVLWVCFDEKLEMPVRAIMEKTRQQTRTFSYGNESQSHMAPPLRRATSTLPESGTRNRCSRECLQVSTCQ